MRKVYTAVVRVVVDNPDGDVTATEDQIADTLANCVSLDVDTESGENYIGNDQIGGVEIEWDNLQFVYNLTDEGEIVAPD